MKKILTLTMVLVFALGAQAQIGGLVGGAVKRGIQKSVEKKMDEALGNNQQQSRETAQPQDNNTAAQVEDEGDHIPTPEEVMAMVPKIPTYQNIADYLCEQSRESPRMLKLMANPTTTFLTQMTIAAANGYVTMVASNGTVYSLDEQMRSELGITEEQYEAMSEEEQQALARRYAEERNQRYARTVEVLAEDKQYNELLDQYNAIEDQIRKLQDDAEAECRQAWNDKHAASGDLCAYYRDAVPIYHRAVLGGMDIRKKQQLAVAKKIDERVQTLAKQRPHDVFAGFYNMGGLCATAYVSDAAILTSIPDPR